jgi:hypothetical protein
MCYTVINAKDMGKLDPGKDRIWSKPRLDRKSNRKKRETHIKRLLARVR